MIGEKEALFDIKTFGSKVNHPVTWGEIACTLSHIKTWRLIAEDDTLPDNGVAVVAEDDISLLPEAEELIARLAYQMTDAKEEFAEDINLIRLHRLLNPNGSWNGDDQLIDFWGSEEISNYNYGSALYLIRKSKAKSLLKLLSSSKPFWLADWFADFTESQEILNIKYNFKFILQ